MPKVIVSCFKPIQNTITTIKLCITKFVTFGHENQFGFDITDIS